MEIRGMGKVVTEAWVENHEDLWMVRKGAITPDQVRRFIIPDAIVDSSEIALALPISVVNRLGLRREDSSSGFRRTPVRLTILDRDCIVEVREIPDGESAVIGLIPIGYLDLVIDPARDCLIGNPNHNGELAHDAY